MGEQASASQREAFYAAAVVGLRALDAMERTPRRLGVDADARWEAFRGALGPADRLDVLLRDAAVTWGIAFSPAQTFSARFLPPDETYGPEWKGVTDEVAKKLLARLSSSALQDASAALGIKASAVELPRLTPSTRVIVAGGAAILALAEAFRRDSALSWSDQVVVAASSPAFRQLGGLAAVAIGARAKSVVVSPDPDPRAVLRRTTIPQVDVAVISSDAEGDAADFARLAAGGR